MQYWYLSYREAFSIQSHQAGSNAPSSNERPATFNLWDVLSRASRPLHAMVAHVHQPDVVDDTGEPGGTVAKRLANHTRRGGCESCGSSKSSRQSLTGCRRRRCRHGCDAGWIGVGSGREQQKARRHCQNKEIYQTRGQKSQNGKKLRSKVNLQANKGTSRGAARRCLTHALGGLDTYTRSCPFWEK